MNVDQVRAGLIAVRAQVDSLLLALADTTQDRVCPHPPECREDTSVMGQPERWRCKACGYEHQESV